MKIITHIKDLQKALDKPQKNGQTIGFVPTMGYLHEGHLRLVRQCRKENDLCVLSIFINPAQFGPGEDFQKYPRDKKRDESFAKKEKVDIIFYPSVEEMYPSGYLTYVDVGALAHRLCGQSRPGHFKGVATVVLKLLNAVTPDTLYLGQKDAQQVVVIKKMIVDFNLCVRVKAVAIVREPDGLAMSSRNVYLSSEERHQATSLYRSLTIAKDAIKNGERNPGMIQKIIKHILIKNPDLKIDYIACVDSESLIALKRLQGKVLIALAAYVGQTRLIDNVTVRI